MNKSLEEPLGDDHSVSLQVESHGHGHGHGGHGHDHGHDHGGHGHGHDHGSHGHGGHGGHGHSHGGGDACCGPKPRQSQKLPWYVIRGFSMKSFIYGMVISVWVMVYNYFCEPLTDDFDRKGSKLLITFQVIMAIISYYRCSNISSANPTKDIPVYATAPYNETCKKCSYWKPERSHHCSKCRECVLRMDHHCPWIVNCVGYHNHKSFFLFCFYIATGGMFYTYRNIYYLVCVLKDDALSAEISYTFIALWIFQSGLILSFMLMVGGLTYYHWTLALNNMTTLESMGGRNMRFACESHIAQEKKMMNKYDRGFLANLYEFFGHTVFLWWWPTRPNAMYLGQYLRKVMMPTEREAQDFYHGKTNEESAEEKALRPRRIEDIDLQNVFKMAQEYAPDTTFQFFDKTFKKQGETTVEVSQGETQNQPELMNS